MNAQSKIEVAPLAKLREPFPDNQISKLPKETRSQIDARKGPNSRGLMVFNCSQCGGHHHKDAVHLDYVGHAALTDRLLETDIEWSWEPVAFGPDGLPVLDRNGGLWIRLTVCGVTRLGYGDADGKTGGNAIKEAIGDALRNAAMRFGAALDLWHKGDLHAEDESDPNGGSGQEQNGGRAASPTGTAEQSQGMPDAEWSKLVQLIEATKSNTGKMLKHYGVADLRLLDQSQYADAVQQLNNMLADMAKAETNKAASGFGEVLEGEIPY